MEIIEQQNIDNDESSSVESSVDEEPLEENLDESGNANWANCFSKILAQTKPKSKKTIVLSRAKNLQNKAEHEQDVKSYDFEIDGELKEEKPNKEVLDFELVTKKTKNQHFPLRLKATAADIERERTLRKIATKGVVQLFNAVRYQQRELQEKLSKAGTLDSKRDAVLNNIDKGKFLDVLMSGTRAKSELVDNPVKKEMKPEDNTNEYQLPSKKSEWSVLKDNFLTAKGGKHWDEEDDEGEDALENVESEDSYSSNDDD